MTYKGRNLGDEISPSELKKIKKSVSNGRNLRDILTGEYPDYEFAIISCWNDLDHLDSVSDVYFSLREAKQNCPKSPRRSALSIKYGTPPSKDHYIVMTGKFRELAEGKMTTGFSESPLEEDDIDFIYEKLETRL